MTAIARVGDLTSGHGCHPPQVILQGSSNVFVEGIQVQRVGDPVSTHCCGDDCHDSVIQTGSQNININGIPQQLIGLSQVGCGGVVAKAADSVFGMQ